MARTTDSSSSSRCQGEAWTGLWLTPMGVGKKIHGMKEDVSPRVCALLVALWRQINPGYLPEAEVFQLLLRNKTWKKHHPSCWVLLPNEGTAHSALAGLWVRGQTAAVWQSPAFHGSQAHRKMSFLSLQVPAGQSWMAKAVWGRGFGWLWLSRGKGMPEGWMMSRDHGAVGQGRTYHKSTVEVNLSLFIFRLVEVDKSLRAQVRAEWSRQNRIQRVFNS